jgi:putative endonuclease
VETWTVYLLRCSDDKIYTGCTGDFNRRLEDHRMGLGGFTSSRLPLSIIVKVDFYDKQRAFDFERYLKSGSGKAFVKRHFQ